MQHPGRSPFARYSICRGLSTLLLGFLAVQAEGCTFEPAGDSTADPASDSPVASGTDEGVPEATGEVLDAKSTSSFPMNQWMRGIPDVRSLADISIPGTHDSGALYDPPGLPGTAAAQTEDLQTQLTHGVRFLDIRLRYIDGPPKLVVHHGAVYQNLSGKDVVDICVRFLVQNPSETIVMSINEDLTSMPWDTSDKHPVEFEDQVKTTLVDRYLPFVRTFDKKRVTRFFTENRIPSLGEVRGRIVLLRRFEHQASVPHTAGGIDASHWENNQVFTTNNLVIEDVYQGTCISGKTCTDANFDSFIRLKESTVAQALKAARADRSHQMHLTFTSATYLVHTSIDKDVPQANSIPNTAKRLNPYVRDQVRGSGPFGIVIMDRETLSLSQAIVASNPSSLNQCLAAGATTQGSSSCCSGKSKYLGGGLTVCS